MKASKFLIFSIMGLALFTFSSAYAVSVTLNISNTTPVKIYYSKNSTNCGTKYNSPSMKAYYTTDLYYSQIQLFKKTTVLGKKIGSYTTRFCRDDGAVIGDIKVTYHVQGVFLVAPCTATLKLDSGGNKYISNIDISQGDTACDTIGTITIMNLTS